MRTLYGTILAAVVSVLAGAAFAGTSCKDGVAKAVWCGAADGGIPHPAIDGDLSDWDCAEPVLCWNAEERAEEENATLFFMYDEANLYVAYEMTLPGGRMPENRNRPQDRYWRGDLVQLRLCTDKSLGWPLPKRTNPKYMKNPRVTCINLWRDTASGMDYCHVTPGAKFDCPVTTNPEGSAIKTTSAPGRFTLEARVPWSVLGVADGKCPFAPGERMPAVVDVKWMPGMDGHATASIYARDPGAFAFMNLDRWGRIEFQPPGAAETVSSPGSMFFDASSCVVNAAKAGTQFGSAEYALTNGFSDDNAVFKADSSTLYGITDRADSANKKIIWAGPPIAKLTDGNGRLLYIKYYEGTATYPAIFDRLDTGNSSEGSTASPFSILRMDDLTLYYKDGTPYTGTDYCIKMLVERYETSADMTLLYKEGRTVTFTTADKTTTEEDPYPFEGRAGGRSTVIRGKSIPSDRPLMNVEGTLNLKNIVIDGGIENGVTASNSTRCMYINNASCTVTLGENAVLQNGKVTGSNNGGGVILKDGKLNIMGGVIRNCTAGNDGGGVYLEKGSVTLEAGSIYQCSGVSGGGVRIKDGFFTMKGGTISNCSATKGGGVFVPGNTNYPMYMSGGSIINNSATTAGGGIAFFNNNSRLYLSGKVNISGNTCDASVARNKACNVELNQASKAIINTYGGGLYPGAYVGVYVPGDDDTNPYKDYGGERDNFGTFTTGDNTTNFYSFVNDRNGLKGGIIESPAPNTIYWIKIFALEVSKEVVSGSSTYFDPEELFLFKVNVRGNATVAGQLNAWQIDSRTGEYGEMLFTSNGTDTTTAMFTLKAGESISAVNLSEGLIYEVFEYLTLEQAERYAAMPMNGYAVLTDPVDYGGTSYQVVVANTYTSTIGENKTRTDVDPYSSALTFSNMRPVCKITDSSGNILYRRYDWEKVTNKAGEGQDGGSSTNQPYYYAPAVFTELTGDDGAWKALEGTLYTSNGSNPASYAVSNGVQIQMLIGDYKLNEKIAADRGKITLTTASRTDALFPKQDGGTTSTISRAFGDGSMLDVSCDLTLKTVILDGVKGSYAAGENGGIAMVRSGGALTIQSGAALQNSKTAESVDGGAVYVAAGGTVTMTGGEVKQNQTGGSGAVYVAAGGTVTMTGGTVNRNESSGSGAGIYLAEGGVLNLSGNPYFGGTGLDVGGNITTTNGNFKLGELFAQTNGGKNYTQARQDIFIAGYESDSDDDTSAASLVVSGNLTSGDGTIWVWAEQSPHFKALAQFAKYTADVADKQKTLAAFRNARTDTDSGADQVGQYLYGITKEDDTGKNVFWYGIEGSTHVMLVKVQQSGASYRALAGKTFTVYTDSAGSKVAKGTRLTDSGEEETILLENLSSGAGGAFFIGELSYGSYYVGESGVTGFFEITIDEDGVVRITDPTTNPKTTEAVKTVTLSS